MAIFNEAYIIEATKKIATRKDEYPILIKIAKDAIEKTASKYTKFNIKKYFKLYSNSDNKNEFLEYGESLGMINLIAPGEFAEEYNLDSWLEYNNVLNFIDNYIDNQIRTNRLTGNTSNDIDKNGGWIYYDSNL